MAIFAYKGFDKKGGSVKGTKEAEGLKQLRVALKKEGILATDIEEQSGKGITPNKKNASFLKRDINISMALTRITVEDLSLSTRQFAVLLQAGVPVVDSLSALVDQTENEKLKNVFSEVKTSVNEGLSLADAMKPHKCFTNIYTNMVHAGETSGALEIVLERLSEFLETQAKLKGKIVSAMVYPIIMVIIAFAVLVFMFVGVIPQLTKVFTQANVELPTITKILITMSEFAQGYWWLLLMLIGAGIYGFSRWKQSKSGRPIWDRFKLNAPIAGSIVQMVAIARFSRTLSTLTKSGVPLLSSLAIVKNVVANDAIEKAVEEVRLSVREGESIAKPLARSPYFPPIVTHMVAIGEKSGRLEEMLERIADSYEQRLDNKMSVLTSILEPVMILGMAFMVGFIVLSIILPILKMSQLAQ